MLPDPSVPARDYWLKLTEVPRPSDRVDFPRKDKDGKPICEVIIQVMSQAEMMAANAEAEKTARKLLKDSIPAKGEKSRGYDELITSAGCVEILWRVCRHPDDPKLPFFRSKMDITEHLTVDEIGVLFNCYAMTAAKYGPVINEFESDSELEAWIQTLAEAKNWAPLGFLSLGALRQLVISMASRLYPSPTGSSLLGSLLETSTSSLPTTTLEGLPTHDGVSESTNSS